MLPHRQFSAGMFIRGLPVHGCSVGNSPLGATSDQSPANLQLVGGAHELTNQSYLSSSGRISANFNALLSEAPKSTQASSKNQTKRSERMAVGDGQHLKLQNSTSKDSLRMDI